MILRAQIIEDVKINDKSVIVSFNNDKENQHFEVHCNFSPFYEKMRKWDIWDFKIKWKSEIFTEPKTGKKSYFTHLICSKAVLYHENGSIGKDYKDM